MPRPYLDHPGPWLVAHRGGSLVAPENTLEAFEVASRLGADAIETDVRLSADGHVVVFHDEDTGRITGAPGTIEARSVAEIALLDAAFSFSPDGGATFPRRGKGVCIPTLAQALARFPGMRFSIDAKTRDAALAGALARAVRDAGAEERVCVGSFFDGQSARLRSLLPAAARFLPRWAGAAHVLGAKLGVPGALCPRGFDLAALPRRSSGLEVVTPRTLRHFHRLGIPVHVWTVDAEPEMRELLALGVDGIVTDRPDLLARVLGR
ncbi:MAG TPA: glycerophosphodiester phosphodiesterase [Anaeromyxobacteraceae bacterium]|nr:glycerophosphodiester phosphodiesterase [Anaeromyxobacteraceae bacterium]